MRHRALEHQSARAQVDKALDKYLPKKGKLAKAMRYSVFAGGKRFRPILCLAAAQAWARTLQKFYLLLVL